MITNNLYTGRTRLCGASLFFPPSHNSHKIFTEAPDPYQTCPQFGGSYVLGAHQELIARIHTHIGIDWCGHIFTIVIVVWLPWNHRKAKNPQDDTLLYTVIHRDYVCVASSPGILMARTYLERSSLKNEIILYSPYHPAKFLPHRPLTATTRVEDLSPRVRSVA